MACSYLNFYKYFLYFELLTSNNTKSESVYSNFWHYSHKKQKDSLKAQVVLLIFSVELEVLNISGGRTKITSKHSEKWWLL